MLFLSSSFLFQSNAKPCPFLAITISFGFKTNENDSSVGEIQWVCVSQKCTLIFNTSKLHNETEKNILDHGFVYFRKIFRLLWPV